MTERARQRSNSRGRPDGWRSRVRAPFALACLAACATATAFAPASAEEIWRVRDGRTFLHFNVDLLRDLGIDLEVPGTHPAHVEGLLFEEPYWEFTILPASDLQFHTEYGVVGAKGATSGALRLGGSLVLRDRVSGRETAFDDLEIAAVPMGGAGPPGGQGTEPLLLRSRSTGVVVCELRNSMFDFRGRPELRIHYLNAEISRSWASAIGRPDLAGWVIGIGKVWGGAERLSATAPTRPPYEPRFDGGGLDVRLGGLSSIQQVAHDGTYPGGKAALSMATTSCNVGTEDVPWLAPMEEKHPVIHMALYRLLDGRFEQIGLSWLKHGFYALSNSQCTPCQHPSDGSFLGVGCSDTYDVQNNASRSDLGPRSEVDVYAGTWQCLGSHFAGGQPDCVRRHGSSGHGPLDHRLVAADVDLANPGATYFYEACYVVAGDQNLANNWGHRRCTMTWNGSVWNFSTPAGNPLVEGPALDEWGAASVPVAVAAGDGQVVLAVQTTDLGGGTWHYEYALLNRNSTREIRSFRLPVVGVPNVANLGFHDGDGDAANDWLVSLDADSLVWKTESYGQNPGAHALGFGSLFNFRFDADAAPAALEATLGIFRPGPGTEVTTGTTGPVSAVAAVGGAPSGAGILQVEPNPFRRSVTLRYGPAVGGVQLDIYDASGRLVRRLVDGAPGAGSVVWYGDAEDGTRVKTGVYYARLRAGSVAMARPVVLVD